MSKVELVPLYIEFVPWSDTPTHTHTHTHAHTHTHTHTHTCMHTDLILNVFLKTGLSLDLDFTVKAVRGMLEEMKNNPSRFQGKRVLFIHTGKEIRLYGVRRCGSEGVWGEEVWEWGVWGLGSVG